MSLKTGLQWYWDLTSSPSSIVDQHSGLSLGKIGTVTTIETGGPDGGPCINCGAAAGKYRNAAVAKLPSYESGFSINIWVYSTADSSFGNWCFSHRFQNATDPRYAHMYVRSSDDDVIGVMTLPSSSTARGDQAPLNEWQMLTGVLRNGEVELWRNASLIGTSGFAGDLLTEPAPLSIGGNSWNTVANTFTDHRGRMAKSGVWSRPLDPEEMEVLFNEGAGRNYSDLISGSSRRRRMMMMQRGGL